MHALALQGQNHVVCTQEITQLAHEITQQANNIMANSTAHTYNQLKDKDSYDVIMPEPWHQNILEAEPEKPPRWVWCNMVTSSISVFFCAFLGLPAFLLSILSYVDHHNARYRPARDKRRLAYLLSLAAITIGAVLITVFVVGGVRLTIFLITEYKY